LTGLLNYANIIVIKRLAEEHVTNPRCDNAKYSASRHFALFIAGRDRYDTLGGAVTGLAKAKIPATRDFLPAYNKSGF
jgi:hypothetical protein